MLAISCAHDPDAALVDENGQSVSADAPPALAAEEGDKGALENETKQMLNQDTPSQQVADASAASVAQGEDANTAPDAQANVAPLVDPLASMNPAQDASAVKPADVVAPVAEAPAAQVAQVEPQPSVAPVVEAAPAPVTVAQTEAPKVEAPAPAPAPVVKKHRARKVHAATQLNRYYFLRTGDSPEYLSKLFYGTPDKADQLVGWNQPRDSWQAGKVIYFNSAVKPADRKMRSFYQEKAVAAEDYVTQPGDSLAKIAQDKYGSSLSAREIAATNDLRSDAALPVGKKIKLYPTQLSGEVVAKKSDAELIKAEIAKVENEAAKAAPVSPAVAEAKPVPMPAPVVVEHEKASLASMEVTSFARQNPIVVIGLGALFVLLGSFFIAARKRVRSRLDF